MGKKFQLEILLRDQYLGLQETLKDIENLSGLEVSEKPIAPLHLGVEEVSIVLNIIGSLSAIIALIEYLRGKNKKFEIQFRTKSGEIITLSKSTPWEIEDIKKFLKLTEEEQ